MSGDDYANFEPASDKPVDEYADFEPASTEPLREVGVGEAGARGFKQAATTAAAAGPFLAGGAETAAANVTEAVAKAAPQLAGMLDHLTGSLREGAEGFFQIAHDVKAAGDEQSGIQPTEHMGTAAKVANVAGGLPVQIPTFPLSAAEGAQQNVESGMDAGTAQKVVGVDTAVNAALGVVPPSLRGGLAKRIVSGAAIGEGANLAGKLGHRAVGAPSEPLVSTEDVVPAAVGAVMGGAFGGRAKAPEARAAGADLSDKMGQSFEDVADKLRQGPKDEAGGETHIAPNGATITREQWDNASDRVRKGWMKPAEDPGVAAEVKAAEPDGDVKKLESILAETVDPENRKLIQKQIDEHKAALLKETQTAEATKAAAARAKELRRLAGRAADAGLPDQRKTLLEQADKLDKSVQEGGEGIEAATVAPEAVTLDTKTPPAEAVPTAGIEASTEKPEKIELAAPADEGALTTKGLKVTEPKVEHITLSDDERAVAANATDSHPDDVNHEAVAQLADLAQKDPAAAQELVHAQESDAAIARALAERAGQQAGGADERGATAPTQDAAASQQSEPAGDAGAPGREANGAAQEVDLFGDPIVQHQIGGKAIEEIPVGDLHLSEDVPQFNGGANDSGVVEALGGKFERTGVAPIQAWRRKSGKLEVISGRHRLDLARRSGESTIPAQVHDENAGFTADHAATLDAELNIRDGQGSVSDFASFFRRAKLTEKEAEERGLLARQKGRSGFVIADKGSDELVAAHRAGAVSDEGARALADVAPRDARMQQLGMERMHKGDSIAQAVNTVRVVKMMAADRKAAGQQGDIFGFDDSAMREAADMARAASKEQRSIREQIAAVQGAAKRPEQARKMGVDVKDPAGIQKRITELKQEADRWDNWPVHPDLVERVRPKPEQKLAARRPTLELTAQTEAERLAEEKATAKKQAEQEAADKSAADKAKGDQQRDNFTLTGSNRTADQGAAAGQRSLFRRQGNATQKRNGQEGSGREHQGIPQGQDVRQNRGQVRQVEGEQAGSGGGVQPAAQERPETVARRTPTRVAHDVRDALIHRFGRRGIVSLENKGALKIVNTVDELPKAARAFVGDDTGIHALYDPVERRAYLIADRVRPGDEPSLLAHELGEHYGMEEILGDKYNQFLNDVRALNRSGAAEAKEAWDYVRQQYPHEENSHNFVREVAARLIEQAPHLPFVKRLVAEVKAWLYRSGFRGKFDEDTVRGLALQSLRKAMRSDDMRPLRNGDSLAARDGDMPDQTKTPSFRRWFGQSVVTEDGKPGGKPLVVYHGGLKWNEAKMSGDRRNALWLTDHFPTAVSYADQHEGRNTTEIKPLYATIETPLDLRNEDVRAKVFGEDKTPTEGQIARSRGLVEEAIHYAKANNYDGVIHADTTSENHGGGTSYVVFNPAHIKLAKPTGDESQWNDRGHPLRTQGNRGTFDLYDPNILAHRAFHGSPHDITDRFSTDKIGTGEGAQTYGWGLYFAENSSVAAGYHKQLADAAPIEEMRLGSMTLNDRNNFDYSRRASESDVENVRASLAEYLMLDDLWIRAVGEPGFQAHVLKELDDRIANYYNPELDQKMISAAKTLRRMLERPGAVSIKWGKSEGGIYQVEIDDKAIPKMLEWDKPLSDQPENVRSAFESIAQSRTIPEGGMNRLYNPGKYGGFPKRRNGSDKAIDGAGAYQELVNALGTQEAASKYLNEHGVPGIKYLDQGSRGGPLDTEGTHNIVVFDDKIITLTHKDGTPVTKAERADFVKPADDGMMAARRPDITSIKNDTVAQEREKRGMPEAEDAAKRSFGKVWEDAAPEGAAGWQKIHDLVGELKDNPRPLTDTEDAMLLHQQISLQGEYDHIAEDMAKAYEAGDMDAIASSRGQAARISDDLLDLYNINKRSGTENARGLNARKIMAAEDYSLAKMVTKAREALGGRPLTDTERDQVVESQQKIKDTQEALDRHLAKPGPRRSRDESILESIKTRLRNRIVDLQQQIDAGVKNPSKGKNKVELDAEAKQLRDDRDEIKKQYDEMFGRGLSVEKKMAMAKTRLKKLTEALEKKTANEEFESTPKGKTPMDGETLKLKAENEAAKLKFERAKMQWRLNGRNMNEKVQDTLIKWRRAFLLSSPVTLAKLTSAAVERMAFTPIEDAVGSVLGALPGVSQIAARAPREGGLNIAAEAKAFRQAMTQGMADSAHVLRTGNSQLDTLFGKRNVMPHELIDFIGSMHGALKAPVKRAEFERSLEKRTAHAMRQGIDTSDPLVQSQLMLSAYKDANRAIFMQDNAVVAAYKRALSAGKEADKTTGQVPPLRKAITTAAEIMLPIVKVPTNIVAETLQHVFGTATGSYKLAKALAQGVEKLHPDQADLIMRELKKGSLGAALMLTGYLAPEMFGGYYQPEDKKMKGHPKWGTMQVGDFNVPTFLLHNPLLETLQIGATVRHVAESKLKVRDKEKQGIGAGALAATLGVTQEVPFVREMSEITQIFNPYERGKFFDQFARDLVIPLGVQWVAKQFDKDKNGEYVVRDPKGLWESLETAIPGLRNNVPAKRKGVSR